MKRYYCMLPGQLQTIAYVIGGLCRTGGRRLRQNVSQFAGQSGRALLCPRPILLFPSRHRALARNLGFVILLVRHVM